MAAPALEAVLKRCRLGALPEDPAVVEYCEGLIQVRARACGADGRARAAPEHTHARLRAVLCCGHGTVRARTLARMHVRARACTRTHARTHARMHACTAEVPGHTHTLGGKH